MADVWLLLTALAAAPPAMKVQTAAGVVSVDLETYVAGVVAAELGDVPAEAAKAQAIVARTYALGAVAAPRHDGAHVCDKTHCQVYRPTKKLAPSTETKGRVLVTEHGTLADVYFSAACGGRTLPATAMWPEASSQTVGVIDERKKGVAWCAPARPKWREKIRIKKLAKALSECLDRPVDAGSVYFNHTILATTELAYDAGDQNVRRILKPGQAQRCLAGKVRVPSPVFRTKRRGAHVHLEGTGRGHTVGLCQAGATARAAAGQKAEAILRAYFPRYRIAPAQ